MKTKKVLSILAFIPMMLTACSKKPFVETEFLNYTGYNVSEVDFDVALQGANLGLGFAGIEYETTSYSNVIRSESTVSTIEEYDSGKIEVKLTIQEESRNKYNHAKQLHSNIESSKTTIKNSSGSAVSSTLDELVTLVYKKNISEAYVQKRIYRNVEDFTTFPTFASYIRANAPVDPNFVLDRKVNFAEFVLDDVPTKYYSHENIYTSGIEYNDRQINTNDYERTLSVSAVNQIVVKKGKVTVNTQYEIKDVKYNFTDEYKSSMGIGYKKLTTNTKFLRVETMLVDTKVNIDAPNLDEYSFVESF